MIAEDVLLQNLNNSDLTIGRMTGAYWLVDKMLLVNTTFEVNPEIGCPKIVIVVISLISI